MKRLIDYINEILNAVTLIQKALIFEFRLSTTIQISHTLTPAIDKLSIEVGVIKLEGVFLSVII